MIHSLWIIGHESAIMITTDCRCILVVSIESLVLSKNSASKSRPKENVMRLWEIKGASPGKRTIKLYHRNAYSAYNIKLHPVIFKAITQKRSIPEALYNDRFHRLFIPLESESFDISSLDAFHLISSRKYYMGAYSTSILHQRNS